MEQHNARLQNIFKLSHRVTIYCPTQNDKGENVQGASDIVDLTLRLLSGLVGGATSTPAVGCWVTGNGQLIKENVTLVFVYCETLTSELVNTIIDHCETIKSTLNQESVAVEIDGELYLV